MPRQRASKSECVQVKEIAYGKKRELLDQDERVVEIELERAWNGLLWFNRKIEIIKFLMMCMCYTM